MSSVDSKTPSDATETADVLAGLDPEHFAGHTAFQRLSVEQKLLWLAHAASFALEARRVRVAEEQKTSPAKST